MYYAKYITLILASATILEGCAVAMAARTGGVKLEAVQACQTRQCFLNQDTVQIIQVAKLPNQESMESYRYQLKRGSAGRAAMHGLLDVGTLGVWEVAGTPIEATKNKKYVTLTVQYSADGTMKQTFLGVPQLPENAEVIGTPNIQINPDVDL